MVVIKRVQNTYSGKETHKILTKQRSCSSSSGNRYSMKEISQDILIYSEPKPTNQKTKGKTTSQKW